MLGTVTTSILTFVTQSSTGWPDILQALVSQSFSTLYVILRHFTNMRRVLSTFKIKSINRERPNSSYTTNTTNYKKFLATLGQSALYRKYEVHCW